MSTPSRIKVVSSSRTADLPPTTAVSPAGSNQPRRFPSRPGDARSNSHRSPVAAHSSHVPELPPGAAPPPQRNVLQSERVLSRSASLKVPPTHDSASLRIRRTRPITIFDGLNETPVIPELVDPRRSSTPPRYSQVVSPSAHRTPREKSSWRPSDSKASDHLYDSSAADARVSQHDVPERWDRPFEVNADEEFLGPVSQVPPDPDTPDASLSGSALAAFLAHERRRDLSLADPFSELAGRPASPRSARASSPRVRSPQVSSPRSPRIGTPRLKSKSPTLLSPTILEEPQVGRTRSHSSPHIVYRAPESDRQPEEERRRPKYARHGWRPSQAAAGDHLYEPPALGDDLPARWERPFDLHDECEVDLQKPKAVPRESNEPPIDRRALNSFLETERRRDLGTSSDWATQLQEMGNDIRADPQTAAVLTRVATMGRDRGHGGRRHRRGHSRNESWDGSALDGREPPSEASRQAAIRAVLDPMPGAVPDCTADGREARRHARRVRQGREDHEDAPPAYMPDRPPVYVEGGTRTKT